MSNGHSLRHWLKGCTDAEVVSRRGETWYIALTFLIHACIHTIRSYSTHIDCTILTRWENGEALCLKHVRLPDFGARCACSVHSSNSCDRVSGHDKNKEDLCVQHAGGLKAWPGKRRAGKSAHRLGQFLRSVSAPHTKSLPCVGAAKHLRLAYSYCKKQSRCCTSSTELRS